MLWRSARIRSDRRSPLILPRRTWSRSRPRAVIFNRAMASPPFFVAVGNGATPGLNAIAAYVGLYCALHAIVHARRGADGPSSAAAGAWRRRGADWLSPDGLCDLLDQRWLLPALLLAHQLAFTHGVAARALLTARHKNSAQRQTFSRLGALPQRCTAMAWIFISAHCFAIP